MRAKTKIALAFVLLVFFSIAPAFALISVGFMNKEEAKEAGITMKSRPDGDAGTKVWIEFKKQGFLEKFTYAELEISDAQGKHRVSARLEPVAMETGQAKDVVTVSFSAEAAELEHCSFLVVAYGSSRGDVGYYLKVKDFLELAAVKQAQVDQKAEWERQVKAAATRRSGPVPDPDPDPDPAPPAAPPPAPPASEGK